MTDLLVTGTFAPKLIPYATCDHTDTPHPKTTWCDHPVFDSYRLPVQEAA